MTEFHTGNHGVVVLTKSNKISQLVKKIIQFQLNYSSDEDPMSYTEVKCTRSIEKACEELKRFKYSILVIDWVKTKDPISKLFPHIKNLPGYKSYDYTHLTYIRTDKSSEALRLFMKQVPLTYIVSSELIDGKRLNRGLSFVGQVFNSRVKQDALEKYFDLYDEGDYEKAYELARIMHDRQPQREFLFILMQAAKNSIEYDETLRSLDLGVDLLNRFGSRNTFLKARKFYKDGNNELANQIFRQLFALNHNLTKKKIVMSFMWMFERFTNVVRLQGDPEKSERLKAAYVFATKLEPRFKKAFINFETFTPDELNAGFFNCRLDMELAVFANVAAFYFSNMEDYDTAGFLYTIASCFIFNKHEVRARILKNLLTCYRKQYLVEKYQSLEDEISNLEEFISFKESIPDEIFDVAS